MNKNTALNIFYADDDEDDRFLFKSAISEIKTAITLSCFTSGFNLEKALFENDYDCELVFLDLNMPGESGLQTLDSLQNAIQTNNLKVVIFTTSADLQVVQKTFGRNAVLFVQKPLNFNSLVATLQQIIDNRNLLTLPILFKDFQYHLTQWPTFTHL